MTTLALRLMIAVVALPMVVSAQVQPAQPPLPPARVKAQRPLRPLPAEPAVPLIELQDVFEFPEMPDMPLMEMKFHLDDMRVHEMALKAQDMAFKWEKFADIDVDRLAAKADQMRARVEQIADIDVKQLAQSAEMLAEAAAMDMGNFGARPKTFRQADQLLRSRPREPWAREDPADSLYRIARETLNRGEYRRAAQLFNEITKRFKTSQYAPDCAYWEAFARYRLGGTDDLKEALRILEGKGEVQITPASFERGDSNVDVSALRARVQGALAARGDRAAADAVAREANQSSGCDREQVGVRAEALSALGQMDRAAAIPVVKKVLARRDECTVELRRRALYVIARDADAESVTLIIDVARNDPDQGVRSEAMRWLPRVAGDNAVPQLEDMLRTSSDEQTQRSAIAALSSIDSDRARKAVRAIIERNDASERVRADAIINLSRDREGRTVSADEINYLRSLYGKLESPRLREAVLTSVSRIETADNMQFLLGIARNQNENTSLRATALQRLGRMSNVNLDDVAKLYDVADARSLREQLLYALYQRKEPAAVDKMMEIARKDTDPQIRRTAISLLARRNDPRSKELIAKLIEQP